MKPINLVSGDKSFTLGTCITLATGNPTLWLILTEDYNKFLEKHFTLEYVPTNIPDEAMQILVNEFAYITIEFTTQEGLTAWLTCLEHLKIPTK